MQAGPQSAVPSGEPGGHSTFEALEHTEVAKEARVPALALL